MKICLSELTSLRLLRFLLQCFATQSGAAAIIRRLQYLGLPSFSTSGRQPSGAGCSHRWHDDRCRTRRGCNRLQHRQ